MVAIVWALVAVLVLYMVLVAVLLLPDLIEYRRRRRREALERELDRTQAELRATILDLASQLGADAHDARRALIRESFLASGRVTPPS